MKIFFTERVAGHWTPLESSHSTKSVTVQGCVHDALSHMVLGSPARSRESDLMNQAGQV